MVLEQRWGTDDTWNVPVLQPLGGASPVVEVHDGLDGVAAPGGDVPLEAGQQRRDHVHPVLPSLSERRNSFASLPFRKLLLMDLKIQTLSWNISVCACVGGWGRVWVVGWVGV